MPVLEAGPSRRRLDAICDTVGVVQRPLLMLAAIAACGGGPQPLGTQPSWRDAGKPATNRNAIGAVTVYTPTGQAADRYNEPLQAPPRSALGDIALDAVTAAASRAGLPVPAADARLFRACAELARVVPEEGVVGYPLVEFTLQRFGIIEPSPHLVVVWGDISDAELIVDQLRPRLPEILRTGATARLGIAAAKRKSDGTGAVVFALQSSGITTAPIPRQVPSNGQIKLNAVIDARYRDPAVLVTRDDGSTDHLALDVGRSGGIKSTFQCDHRTGRQQIEIAASDAAGSTVLANFPVWCGADPPNSLTIEPTAADDGGAIDPSAAEQRLFALMNRDRKAQNLPALVWDERVAAVARRHSDEMRRTKVVAHVSPVTGSAADRVRASGLTTSAVLENVARAYGVEEAHAGLMNSPGHRANLMSTIATHVGISVVLGDEVSGRRELFVTQLFVRFPPKLDPAAGKQLVRARIAEVRTANVSAKLSGIAQQVADGLASGKPRESLWPAAKRELDAMTSSYARVGSVITAVSDLAALSGQQLIGDYQPDDLGIGVAQGKHPDIGDAAMWVVVFVAERGNASRR